MEEMNTSLDSHDRRRSAADIKAGVVAGMIGGIVGTWVKDHVQAWWSKAAQGFESNSAGGRHDSRDWQERYEGENANEIAAQSIAARAIDRELTRDELGVAAPLLHYTFGASMGALYGGLAETGDDVPLMSGAGFGTAVWVAADEVAMPLLGLSKRKGGLPLEAHAQSFAAHVVYGLTTEIVRRGVRALMQPATA
jgi:putative membrane protein